MRFWLGMREKICGGIVVLAMLAGTSLQAEAQRATHGLKVRNGILTVDGLPVETGLNLRIANLHYLYLGLPSAGTALVSEQPFAGAREQKGAFHGNALTVMAGGSRLQLTSANRMRGNRSAYVRFDRGQDGGLSVPALSYGDVAMVPATWTQRGIDVRSLRRRIQVSSRRTARTAKLCRPSAHGGEQCAIVREVVYKP